MSPFGQAALGVGVAGGSSIRRATSLMTRRTPGTSTARVNAGRGGIRIARAPVRRTTPSLTLVDHDDTAAQLAGLAEAGRHGDANLRVGAADPEDCSPRTRMRFETPITRRGRARRVRGFAEPDVATSPARITLARHASTFTPATSIPASRAA